MLLTLSGIAVTLKQVVTADRVSIADTSRSMAVQALATDNGMLSAQNGFTACRGFDGTDSGIFALLRRTALFSSIFGKKAVFFSDFNYTDLPFDRPLKADIELKPLEKEQTPQNISVEALYPEVLEEGSGDPVFVKIVSDTEKGTVLIGMIDGKKECEVKTRVKEGVTFVPLRPVFPAHGVYQFTVAAYADDPFFDNMITRDITVLKKDPRILVVYRYPSADIGIITRLLAAGGYRTDTLSISKPAGDLSVYHGIVYYNEGSAKYPVNGPSLHVGTAAGGKNSGQMLKLNGELFRDIFPAGKPDGRTAVSDDEGKPIIAETDSGVLLLLSNYSHAYLSGNRNIKKLVDGAADRFLKRLSEEEHISMNRNNPVKGLPVRFIFSGKGDVEINGKMIGKDISEFTANTTDNALTVNIGYIKNGMRRTLKRSFSVSENDSENFFTGFNKEKYAKISASLTYAKAEGSKTAPPKKIKIFESIIFFIIVLSSVIYMFIKR